jgi:hypothetical protein
MNLFEAMQTLKPMKRPGMPRFYSRYSVTLIAEGNFTHVLGTSDLLANDWEIEEPKALITSTDLSGALDKATALMKLSKEQCETLEQVLKQEFQLRE